MSDPPIITRGPVDPGDLAETVLDALAHAVAGRDGRHNTMWPKARLAEFDGFEIVTPAIADAGGFLHGAVDDVPVWPMDARWAYPMDSMGAPAESSAPGWHFHRVRNTDPAAWRGRLRRVSSRMYEVAECFVDETGSAWGSSVPVCVFRGRAVETFCAQEPHGGLGRLHSFGNIGRVMVPAAPQLADNYDDEKIAFAHGIELRREYLWSVLLGETGVPRARFATDAAGVRSVFRLRDIQPGASRRAALRHWVREHWRKLRRTSAADRAWINAHLRGRADFTWNGLSCVIEPSRDDLRRAAAPRMAAHV